MARISIFVRRRVAAHACDNVKAMDSVLVLVSTNPDDIDQAEK
jgi:hypothetical protein